MLDAARRFLSRPRTTAQSAVLAAGALAGAALLGSAAFGLVHIVGGTIRGNPRAVSFGVWLSLASVLLLAAVAYGVRRFTLERTVESE